MNTLSAILWNPDIEIFSIFGISIRYYSVQPKLECIPLP